MEFIRHPVNTILLTSMSRVEPLNTLKTHWSIDFNRLLPSQVTHQQFSTGCQMLAKCYSQLIFQCLHWHPVIFLPLPCQIVLAWVIWFGSNGHPIDEHWNADSSNDPLQWMKTWAKLVAVECWWDVCCGICKESWPGTRMAHVFGNMAAVCNCTNLHV